jgi:hypothetical protein
MGNKVRTKKYKVLYLHNLTIMKRPNFTWFRLYSHMLSLACTEMDRDKEHQKHKYIKHLTRVINLEKSCGNTEYIWKLHTCSCCIPSEF